MAFSSTSPAFATNEARSRRRRHRGARADQHRQDPSRDRAHAGAFLRRDRPAAAAAWRARSITRSSTAPGQRIRRADHRRREDQADKSAVLGVDRRSDAARSRRVVSRGRRNPDRGRSRTRPRLHRPHPQPARPRRDLVARRGHHAPHDRAAVARRQHRHKAAAVAARIRRRSQDHPPAAAHRDRRVFRR